MEINTGVRQYRLTTFKKLSHLALACVFFVGTGFLLKLELVLGFLALIPGLILVSLALRSRLTLDGDRIELRSALRTFTANRNEIDGLREIEDQYGHRTRIYLKESRGTFNVSDSFAGDDDLNEWLKGLPNLDKRDADQIERQLSTQDSLGTGENLNALKHAKAWAIGLGIGAGITSIPVLFVTYAPIHNVSLVLLLLLPPVGILLNHRFPLLFTIFKRKTDPRADIGYVVLWPGVAILLLHKFENDPSYLVDASQLIYWVILVVVLYVGSLFRTAWKHPSRWGVLVGLLIFGAGYGVGLIDSSNTLLDRSVPQFYTSQVLKMHVTHGKNTRFSLHLEPWGPIAYDDDVDVAKHIYEEFKVGDQVCIGLHPGFLHAQWYTLTPCDR
jgi:hypothetical protein